MGCELFVLGYLFCLIRNWGVIVIEGFNRIEKYISFIIVRIERRDYFWMRFDD